MFMISCRWVANSNVHSSNPEHAKVIPPRELEEIRLRMAEELDYPSRQRSSPSQRERVRVREREKESE
jgi:hypothetical protein